MKSKWIWFWGDFEIYHNLILHTRRRDYKCFCPPFWNMSDCNHNVCFQKNVNLEKQESITVYSKGRGRVMVDNKRYPIDEKITLGKGEHFIEIDVMNESGLPCIFIDGETVVSDESWDVTNYGNYTVKADSNDKYTSPEDDPQIFAFSYEEIFPCSEEAINGGILYDYGKETFAKLEFENVHKGFNIYFGESKEEAIDKENCYLTDYVPKGKSGFPARAFRYIFIPAPSEHFSFKSHYEYLPVTCKADFKCSDELINKIWNMSVYTLQLNSREFYLDGIKRDRWVWSGDAFQSYLINRYCFFDAEIIKRTIIALRGNDFVHGHLNGIADYSFYWLISIGTYFEMTGDCSFVRAMYTKMKSLLDYCLSRLDKNGFVSGVSFGKAKPGSGTDSIFIDWADMEKDGVVCAAQMLLLKAIETYIQCLEIINQDACRYIAVRDELKRKIDEYFWDENLGAYIDNFETGNKHITRHANIFAILFGYADAEKKKKILKNVIMNNAVTAIKTPYFRFFELDLMCRMNFSNEVTRQLKEYWGGMISEGATTFWEEYNPSLSGMEHYAMYGNKYEKSLCHAWGASPVYIIGSHYMGVKPVSAGYESFEVTPVVDEFDWMEGTVPVKDGSVYVCVRDKILTVKTDKPGGILHYGGKKYKLEANRVITVKTGVKNTEI